MIRQSRKATLTIRQDAGNVKKIQPATVQCVDRVALEWFRCVAPNAVVGTCGASNSDIKETAQPPYLKYFWLSALCIGMAPHHNEDTITPKYRGNCILNSPPIMK